MSVILASLVFSVLLGVAALHYAQRNRELEHRERMAALEKGHPLPQPAADVLNRSTARDYLRRGLLWLFFGIGVFLAFYLAGWSAPDRESADVARFAYAGLVPAAVGAAYLVFYATDPDRQ